MIDGGARLFPGVTRTRLLLLMAGLVCLCACAAPTRTQTSGNMATDTPANGRMVIYPSFQCLSEALAERIVLPSSIMSTTEFQDAMFPWFEPAHAPKDAATFDHLLGKPHVRAKIDDLNIRYLIGITDTDESGGFPGVFCAAGFGAAGCLGLGWENKQTVLSAAIWDMRDAGHAGSFSVTTSGTSLMIGVVLPLVFIANTEEESCQKMADIILDGLAPSWRR